jgi:hypothetical protein
MVLVFLAAAFIGYNEILNSAVSTIVIDGKDAPVLARRSDVCLHPPKTSVR